jgi:antitoxin (DNA-binding transcriptional repressor) of toxin-antitoxin stability system
VITLRGKPVARLAPIGTAVDADWLATIDRLIEHWREGSTLASRYPGAATSFTTVAGDVRQQCSRLRPEPARSARRRRVPARPGDPWGLRSGPTEPRRMLSRADRQAAFRSAGQDRRSTAFGPRSRSAPPMTAISTARRGPSKVVGCHSGMPMLWATAKRAGCTVPFSEDFQDGRRLEGGPVRRTVRAGESETGRSRAAGAAPDSA